MQITVQPYLMLYLEHMEGTSVVQEHIHVCSQNILNVLFSELQITQYVINATCLPQFILHNIISTNYHWLFL